MTKRNLRILAIVICIFAILIIYDIYVSKSLNNHGIYVIGKIERIEGAKGGLRAFVSYKYKGEIIHGDFISGRVKPRDTMNRYFFKIDTLHPHYFDYDYDITVPDSIKEAPYGGWDSLPVPMSPPKWGADL